MDKLCDYGCGQEARYQRKNGKWCCSKNVCQCPAIRKKLVENHVDSKEVYKNLSAETKRRMNWNKNLTAENNESIRKMRDKVRQQFASGERKGTFTGKQHSKETKKLISKNTKASYNYNVQRKSGRGKKGYYKGFWCDSTYELAYIIYCLDHGISIQRNKEYFIYTYQGKQHRYYPDFIVNGEIIEIKGFSNGVLPFKEQALKLSGKPYKILFPKDLHYVFDYILKTYNKKVNKDISDLYEVKYN